jgi:hypothetical protein
MITALNVDWRSRFGVQGLIILQYDLLAQVCSLIIGSWMKRLNGASEGAYNVKVRESTRLEMKA